VRERKQTLETMENPSKSKRSQLLRIIPQQPPGRTEQASFKVDSAAEKEVIRIAYPYLDFVIVHLHIE
jgi:hypothetical protein